MVQGLELGELRTEREDGLGAPSAPPWEHESSLSSPSLCVLAKIHSPAGIIPSKPRIPSASPGVFFLWLRWYL